MVKASVRSATSSPPHRLGRLSSPSLSLQSMVGWGGVGEGARTVETKTGPSTRGREEVLYSHGAWTTSPSSQRRTRPHTTHKTNSKRSPGLHTELRLRNS